jgi:CheY-like chemotaxis protein
MGGVLAPAAPRKILWADDDPRDIEGVPRFLRFQGHTVVSTVDFETTAELLAKERFDLLVVDQQMPRGGRRTDDAGSQLVQALALGEFGDLNVGIPFMFITASEEWVSNSDIRVEDIDGFLRIEEKGDDLFGPLEEILSEIPARSGESSEATEDQSDDDCDDHEPPGVSAAPPATEEWAGVVRELEADRFWARLTAIDRALPDHEAVIPRLAVAEGEQPLIVEGATFRWWLVVEDAASGERVTRSWIRFDPTEPLEDAEIAAARERVRARREPDGDAGA